MNSISSGSEGAHQRTSGATFFERTTRKREGDLKALVGKGRFRAQGSIGQDENVGLPLRSSTLTASS